MLYNLLYEIKNIDYNNEYIIKYILKFTIDVDILEKTNIDNNIPYTLSSIKNIESIDFNKNYKTFSDTDSLILIISKKDKVYYTNIRREKKNKTKKNINYK